MPSQEEKHTFKTGASRSKLDSVRLDLVSPISMLFKGMRYAGGAVHHGDNNWRKGMPCSAILNHMMRHLMLWSMGDRSDDHLAAVEWGAAALQEQEFTHPEMNDLFRFPPDVIERVKRELVTRWERDFPPKNQPRRQARRTKR